MTFVVLIIFFDQITALGFQMHKIYFLFCLLQESLMSGIHSPEALHPPLNSPFYTDPHTYALPTGSGNPPSSPPLTARAPNIWCMDVADGLIVAGCSNGNIEFWDSVNGSLKYRHSNAARSSGIASIKAYDNR